MHQNSKTPVIAMVTALTLAACGDDSVNATGATASSSTTDETTRTSNTSEETTGTTSLTTSTTGGDDSTTGISGSESDGETMSMPPVCGDNNVDPEEACDDGINDGSYNGCMPDCSQLGPHCGDNNVDPEETCEEGVEIGLICQDFPNYSGGTLKCDPNLCQLDFSSCTSCTQVTCLEIFQQATYFNPADYDVSPCSIPGDNKIMNWAEGMEAAVVSEGHGTMCGPFDPTLWDPSLDITKLKQMTEQQVKVLMCLEFLGLLSEIPDNWQEPVCNGDIQAMQIALENFGPYWAKVSFPTQHKVGPDFQTIFQAEFASLEPLPVDTFYASLEWGMNPPSKCRLQVEHHKKSGVNETAFSPEQPMKEFVNPFPIPGGVLADHVVFQVQCVLSAPKPGFAVGGGLDNIMTKHHNLMNMDFIQSVSP